MDLNKIMISGRLVRDPELKYTGSGTGYCTSAIASNHKYKEQKSVCFVEFIVWGKSAENFAEAARAESLHEETKSNGGEIKNLVIRGGFIAPGVANSPQAWEAISRTSQGATDVVEVNQQFYIFWVHDRTAERQRPFSEVKEQVEADYRRERQEQAAQDLLNRTLEEQEVEIYADQLLK